MGKRIYYIDFNKLIAGKLLIDLRKPKMMAWLIAQVAPVVDLYNRFIAYKNYTDYQLSITPQVCFIEKALNDRYDPIQRRIYITKPAQKLPFVLYLKDENKPQTIYKKTEGHQVVLYTKGETAQFTVNFIVKVPVFVVFNMDEMTAFVNVYKLPSKNFKIMIF